MKGLPYFPIETNWLSDAAVEQLVDELGPSGLGIWVIILTQIYTNGYYIAWSDEAASRFARKNLLQVDDVKKTVDACLRLGLFSPQHFSAHAELTSKAIIDRFLRVRKKSADGSIEERFKDVIDAVGDCRNFSEQSAETTNQLTNLNKQTFTAQPVDNLLSVCRSWVENADIKKPSSSYIECAHQLVDAFTLATPPGAYISVTAVRQFLKEQKGIRNWKYLTNTKIPNEIERVCVMSEVMPGVL